MTKRNRGKDKYLAQDFSNLPVVRKKISKTDPFHRASFTFSPIPSSTIQ